MDAPHTARIARGRGAVQYAARAFPRSSSPSAMPPLPLPALRDPTVEVRPVPRPGPRPLGEEVRDGGPAERVDEAAHHPLEGLPVRRTLPDPIADPLRALATDRDEALVHEPVQGRRHARVRDVPGPPDLPVNLPRGRLSQGPEGAEDRELEVSEFHGIRQG